MKTFCIIPARYGSTRVQGKPLRKISDKTLIEWTWHNALAVSSFSDVFITTDSDQILDVAKNFGAKVIKTSSDHKSGTDRVAEAAGILNIEKKDIVVNIQADEPLISSLAIKELVLYLKKREVNMATLAYKSSDAESFEDSNVVKVVVDRDDFALYFSRSSIPFSAVRNGSLFLKHLGVYGYTMDFLQKITALPASPLEEVEKLEQLRVIEHGYKIKILMSTSDSQSFNTEKDFKKAEGLFKNRVK